jgi:hypothetical protein
MPRIRFPTFVTRAVAIGLGLLLAGVLSLILAANIEHESTATVVREVGAVLLTIGALELGYEVVLRTSLVQEVFRAVRLEENVAASGLEEISTESPHWSRLFADAHRIAVLPLDPISWIGAEWAHVLEAARRRRLNVRIYLPRWDGPAVPTIADRLEVGEEELRANLKGRTVAISDAWRASATNRRLRRGCELSVLTYDLVPSYGIATADEQALVSLPASTGSGAGSSIVTLRFAQGTNNVLRTWFHDQLAEIATVSVFEDRV